MKIVARVLSYSAIVLIFTACSVVDKLASVDAASTPIPPAKLYLGSDVAGAWSPNVSGAGTGNLKNSVTTTTQTFTKTGVGMVRFQDPWGSKEVLVDLGSFDAANTFGYSGANGNGSITLTADTLNYPYSGGAYPVLTSFYSVAADNSVTEFVNLNSGCGTSGMWVCAGSTCDANSACSPIPRVQKITLSTLTSGGSYTLSSSSGTTAAIPLNSNAATVQSSLQAVSGLTSVSVTGSPATSFTATFTGPDNGLTATATSAVVVTVSSTGSIGSSIPRTQTVSFANQPISGSYIINYNGNATSVILYNSTSASIQTAIQALTGISDVVVSNLTSSGFTVDFTGISGLSITSNTLLYSIGTNVTTLGTKGAFGNRDDWDQHQTPPYGYTSVNSFPRCDSTVGGWYCPSNLNKLPTGHYYAKYILMSDRGVGVSTASADLQVKLTIKKDSAARNQGSSNGAINLNVILVGSKNINDSHTSKGAMNLNLLFKEVNRIFKNEGTNISIGTIKAYEWRDVDGGDYYSEINYEYLGELFSSGSQGVPSADDGNYINIFMVRDIQITGVSYSILGLSGAILGPPVNGTQSSGLAFSTNLTSTITGTGVLSDLNPNCTTLNCTRNSLDADFIEMGATVAHELGHYLGLNHPSEKVASLTETQRIDQLSDTPTCAPRAGPNLDQKSCYIDTALQIGGASTCASACDAVISAAGGTSYYSGAKTIYYCKATSECQFNHMMWYTTKKREPASDGTKEDGNLISPQSSAIVQWNSFVR